MTAEDHTRRWRRVSNRYPRRVAEAFEGDIAKALTMTDDEVAAAVAKWEVAHGLEPRDWRAIGHSEGKQGSDPGAAAGSRQWLKELARLSVAAQLAIPEPGEEETA